MDKTVAEISISICFFVDFYGSERTLTELEVVPLAGLEPALLAEADFESAASTISPQGPLFRTAKLLPQREVICQSLCYTETRHDHAPYR